MKIEEKIRIGKRLQALATKSYAGNKNIETKGITDGGTGGNLTTAAIIPEILSPNFMEGSIFERCTKWQVQPGHNSIKIPITAEVSRTVLAGIAGGLQANCVSETSAMVVTTAAFTNDELVLNKVPITQYVTSEILEDAPVLSGLLHNQFEKASKFYVDHYILYGNSVAQVDTDGVNIGPSCNGILNSGSRATHLTALPASITLANVRSIVSSYYGSPDGVWVMGADMYSQVLDLVNANNAYKAISFHPNKEGEIRMYLFGYEVIVKDCVRTGDIILGDWKAYNVAMIDPRTDMSNDVEFLTDQKVYKVVLRINGMPGWIGGITTQGTKVVYPFSAGYLA